LSFNSNLFHFLIKHFSTDPQSAVRLLSDHIKKIQSIDCFKKSKIVLIPESNLGFEAVWAGIGIRDRGMSNVIIMSDDSNRTGVRVDHTIKNIMCSSLENSINNNTCVFWKDFVCVHELNTPQDTKKKFMLEMRNFARKIKYPPDVDSAPKIIYNGKQGFGYDDLVMAFALAKHMMAIFFENPRYEMYRK
jgi:hypothetical protein